ncbi:MAG: ectoine/hydroxyectoine ABC transporter ATP-binding protein EhuA [Nitrospinae bacterium CG11_big_fil_rev_8_21_14_0_20_56_8]|nr:MAG: ectoine/hydroxyectoine ABC transporter ATP-binding protein EhuA [Nitrospinae bacterium CG11_big_fil_rev_8_21_14_0_20_56_8]
MPPSIESSPSASPILRLKEVHKSYGALNVLNGITLDVPTSQKVALIGPSGSGKSTLLRIVMTLEGFDSGKIEIDGETVEPATGKNPQNRAAQRHLKQVRSKVGMVFQSFNLFPHMSVLHNITEAPIHVLGHNRDRAEAEALELLDRVGLKEKRDSFPFHLSGGQKQRVAIARALALQPRIMLFDEITSALDPERVGEVLNVLRQLALETDITLLVVTHQMHFAREISDRVIFFEGGNIVEDDTPEVVLERPHHPRTREFLQSILDTM